MARALKIYVLASIAGLATLFFTSYRGSADSGESIAATSIQGATTEVTSGAVHSDFGSDTVRMQGHFPGDAVARSTWQGRLASQTRVPLVFALPLRNQAELQDLLSRIYDPTDPLYGHYLTAKEFANRFGPTESDYQAVSAYARHLGFKVMRTHPNRLLLDVTGSAAQIESGFHLHMHRYLAEDGREFYAPDNDPEVPDSIALRVEGVVGLDNAAVWRSHALFAPATEQSQGFPLQIGTGPGGALTPANIVTAYNLGSVAANGSGQSLALFELDGYKPSDVAAYASFFSLAKVPLKNVLIDGFSGNAGSGASEVTLDIELMMALAPGASQIVVYEGPNSNTGVVDTYNRIATDNLASQISTSWGLSEGQSSRTVINSENAIFQQMAAQGQSIFAASGDSGAYDNGTSLSVDDPASQPYITGAGGTELFVGTGETYLRESSWNVNNTARGGAGGGGVSTIWAIPSWQQGVTSAASGAMRNVPDLALNADQYTGYSIYYNGGWYIFGGTSCAAPLWAAFTARVNQQRLAAGWGPLGFVNPPIYQIGQGSGYAASFHDIADGSNNLYYVALTGYDNSTGWGSFNGANLFAALAPASSPTGPPAIPAGLVAVAGNGTVKLTWSPASGATSYNVYRATTSGAEGTTPIASGIIGTGYTDNVTNGITYYYKVSATNSFGTSAPSSEVSASPTAPALAITGGPNATAGQSSAQIAWTTNLASNSSISYGTSSGNLNRTVSNASLVTSHALTLSSLARRTRYFYKVSSTAGGTAVSSAVVSFTTH